MNSSFVFLLFLQIAYVYCRIDPGVVPKIFSKEELIKYDGSDPQLPIYLAIMGKVFDVTDGRKHYAPGGGYSYFAGRDASRSFVNGCFTMDCPDGYDGLNEEQLKGVQDWVDFYDKHAKYFFVGYTQEHEDKKQQRQEL